MSQDLFDVRAKQPGIKMVTGRIVGTGASVPTKVSGKGWTIARTSAGLYTLTFAEKNGTFLGAFANFQATTMADLDGYTCVFGAYNTSARTLGLTVYSDTPTAADLQALGWMNFFVLFTSTATGNLT